MKVWPIALSLPLIASLCAQPPQGRLGRGPANLESGLTQRLGLNATQQNTLHTALEEERTQIRGMMQQRQTLHQSLVAAIKAGNADQIEQVTQQIASLDQQRSAIHAKAMMKFYSGLTADQKTKVGPNLELLLGPGRGGGSAMWRARRNPPPQ
jgi:Spy/CpxP family protein refolding chaperone